MAKERHNPEVTPDMGIRMLGQSTICGAMAKATGLPCRRIPMDNGRCQVHGGKSTGPKVPNRPIGNKHAVTTGQYESIWYDTLDDNEQDLVTQIDTDVIKQIDDAIKMESIRERRMMQRIKNINDEHEEYVARAIDKLYGKVPKPEDAEVDDSGEIIRTPIQTTEYMEHKVEFIHMIEDALTKLRDKKIKLLDLKHKILSGNGDSANVDVSIYVNAIENSGKELWDDLDEPVDADDEV